MLITAANSAQNKHLHSKCTLGIVYAKDIIYDTAQDNLTLNRTIRIIMSDLADKLKTLMRRNNITETELARKTKIGQPVIHRMASGNTINPKVLTLLPIAQHFNLHVCDLINDAPLPQQSDTDQAETLFRIPLVPFEKLPQWLEPLHIFEPEENSVIDRPVGDHAFATMITDSSMRPTMPEGTLMVIDPEYVPKNLDYILVYRKSANCCLIKQLLIDGEQNLLKPHNRDFQIQELRSNDHIVGPVIQTKMDHKHAD